MLNVIVRDYCHYTREYRGAAHSICNLKYGIPKKIIHFLNGINYDNHFTIKRLAEELEGQFTCLEENTEKDITFSVLIKKEVKRSGEEIGKTISHKLKLTDAPIFMTRS